MSFFCRQNNHNAVADCSKDPDLINKQYKYMSLGEMVQMYHATGQFPAVGMRNGVYTGDTVPPNDKFDVLDIQRDIMARIESEEAKINDAKFKMSEEEKQKNLDMIAKLKEQISKMTSHQVAPSQPEE